MRSIHEALGLLAVFLMLIGPTVRAAETVYVQPLKSQLKAEPKMNGTNVAELKRGEALVVVQKEGVWYHVSIKGGVRGWISKLFVSDHKPVGAADLNNDVSQNLAKASRQRSGSYAVSASTRGLSASERVREGRSLYRPDFDALQKIEQQNVERSDLDNFQKSASLSSY